MLSIYFLDSNVFQCYGEAKQPANYTDRLLVNMLFLQSS